MRMNKIFAAVLIVFSLSSLEAPRLGPRDKANMKKAIMFMTKMDRELNRLTTAASHAFWNWKVNITKHNLKISEKVSKIASEYSRKLHLAAREYPWKSYKEKNSTLHRWFELAAKGLGSIDPSGLYAGKDEDSNPYSKMSEIFGKVKVCPPEESTGECTNDVVKAFAATRSPKELKHYWLEFRKKTGEKYKDLFLEAIKKDNKDASKFGYKNKATFNIALYEDKDFVKNMAEEIRKILPFYTQIHAYVRKKLRKHHKSENIKSDGPIPAHLLGDTYAQKWNNIFEIVKPYPNSSGLPNATKAMNAKKMKAIDMFMMAEKFFTSIGLPEMTPRFWHYSMIQKPVGREVDCHASAHTFNDGKDYRIKMCTRVDTNDLEIVHHEMGHIEYYMLYKHLPFLFRESANPGFHEAIGDAISLSVLTPSYLKQVGLLKKNEVRKNKVVKGALHESPARIGLQTKPDSSKNITQDHCCGVHNACSQLQANRRRQLQYQGVCPPSKRSEKHFDIGAKWHIAGGVEYFRYYVANILQFQIHKILCKEAGHKGPLHECNIYKNKKAGKAFGKFLSQGRAKNWKQLLRTFSGGAFRKLDASAMLEYFKPLMDWLKKKNAKEYVGWKSNDPMSCPDDEESTGSDTTHFATTLHTESTTSD
ncbi:Angiotensin-converting enzyme [Araneus ventricosus]|uniref:Angiotensin-converting enzyme n=1 Tax=Araneus ventricosus TaxID=182803 RepID=A0A4Y2LCX5_ARAVE|nr:Angiotensin-converting enzyme [Araneus ventricosus]